MLGRLSDRAARDVRLTRTLVGRRRQGGSAMTMAIGIIVGLLAGARATATPCEPAACLAVLQERVHVAKVAATAADLTGVWSHGSGLDGSVLYLFEDGAFIQTEWADILPETIDGKGTWEVNDGLLLLVDDRDVTWKHNKDRLYLALRIEKG